MRKIFRLLVIYSFLPLLISCNKDDVLDPVPVAPILKDIVMPAESNALPGSNVTIQGKGFDYGDSIICKSLSGEADFSPKVVSVDNYSITIIVPGNAAGNYRVSVERADLVTVLTETLKVPYLVTITNLTVPTSNFAAGSAVTILGTGFESGDKIRFESTAYPSGVSFTADATITTGGITVTIPGKCFATNILTVVRGKKVGTLGEVKIPVSVGDAVGGGVVYYTSAEGLHGLIVNKTNTGTAAEFWGPSIPASYAGGTSADIYKGKSNTASCAAKMAAYRQSGAVWATKTAVEQCDELAVTVDGVVYNDWCLPSLQELVELFKVKALMAEKGAEIPANNYWSSTEGTYASWVWSAFYVNFYESTNIVTGEVGKDVWKVGIRAIRQF